MGLKKPRFKKRGKLNYFLIRGEKIGQQEQRSLSLTKIGEPLFHFRTARANVKWKTKNPPERRALAVKMDIACPITFNQLVNK